MCEESKHACVLRERRTEEMDDEFVAWEPCSEGARGDDDDSARRSTETDSAAPSAPAGTSPPRAWQQLAPLAPDRLEHGPFHHLCRLCPCPSSSSSSSCCHRQDRADLLSASRLKTAWQGQHPCQHLLSGSASEAEPQSGTENDRDLPPHQHHSFQLQPLPLRNEPRLHLSVPLVACRGPPRPPEHERRYGPPCPPPDAEKETGSPRSANRPAAVHQLGAPPSCCLLAEPSLPLLSPLWRLLLVALRVDLSSSCAARAHPGRRRLHRQVPHHCLAACATCSERPHAGPRLWVSCSSPFQPSRYFLQALPAESRFEPPPPTRPATPSLHHGDW